MQKTEGKFKQSAFVLIPTTLPSPTPLQTEHSSNQNGQLPETTGIITEQEQHIQALLAQLTLSQKIGQLLILGIDDTKMNDELSQFLTSNHVGSLILFKRNIKNEKQLTTFVQDLKKNSEYAQIPLWITIDQEGGIVNRLPQKYPSALQLVTQEDENVTYQSGKQMGEDLKAFGIDIDFAPVLDINSNPNNPVIGSRAFGEDAETVTTHAIAMMKGLQQSVITVGKHFPGHGDTDEDSHYTLPTIHKTWSELQELELIPFQAAIDAGIEAIMVGHLYLPKVDESYPASLSSEIITNRLRKEMGFQGLVISDDMVMKGITSQYTLQEATVLAIQAGVDLLIVGHQADAQQDVIQGITDAVHDNVITMEQLDEHVARILKAKLYPSLK